MDKKIKSKGMFSWIRVRVRKRSVYSLNSMITTSKSHFSELNNISSIPLKKIIKGFETFKEKNMDKIDFTKVRIGSSVEGYIKTMPIRGETILVTNPWYVEKSDVAKLLKTVYQAKSKRDLVYYFCAPSNSGKTAAVMNIFANYNLAINNVGTSSDMPSVFDLYLFLPFNNHPKKFIISEYWSGERLQTSFSKLLRKEFINLKNDDYLERVGGVYAYYCLKRLLLKGKLSDGLKFTSETLIKEDEDQSVTPAEMIKTLLEEHNLSDVNFLVNADEHMKISKNELIRKGVLSALGAQKNFTVIATYIKPLADLPMVPKE